MPGIRQIYSRQKESLPSVKTNTSKQAKSSNGQSGVNQSDAESTSGQIGSSGIGDESSSGQIGSSDIGAESSSGQIGSSDIGAESSSGQIGVNHSKAESSSGQIRTQTVSPIVVRPSDAVVNSVAAAVAVAAAETADVDDDELDRLDARFDPAYAAFKTQLDALLCERIPRQFQHLSFKEMRLIQHLGPILNDIDSEYLKKKSFPFRFLILMHFSIN